MIVRFGYVAMSTVVKNASPSKTMTATQFAKLADREAAVRKLERIAAENLHNTLRLLRHNRAYDINVFRFSSRLIPLVGHELLEGWNPIPRLAESMAVIGDFVKKHGMRVGFHPEHFTVLSTPKQDVLRKSTEDLQRHTAILEAIGLEARRAKCNIHIGGTYGNKEKAMLRFIDQFAGLDARIRRRITLENDDKTFNAEETLEACLRLGVPMVLDIHHHAVNPCGCEAVKLWPDILRTWDDPSEENDSPDVDAPAENDPGSGTGLTASATFLPPKIHCSSPKSDKDPRSHADYVNASELLAFLRPIASITPRLDVILEAKMKDSALFRLMEELKRTKGVRAVDQASVEIEG